MDEPQTAVSPCLGLISVAYWGDHWLPQIGLRVPPPWPWLQFSFTDLQSGGVIYPVIPFVTNTSHWAMCTNPMLLVMGPLLCEYHICPNRGPGLYSFQAILTRPLFEPRLLFEPGYYTDIYGIPTEWGPSNGLSVSVMQAGVTCTSFLLTTQLESGGWSKRTMTWRPDWRQRIVTTLVVRVAETLC